jgi:hypothetical protein
MKTDSLYQWRAATQGYTLLANQIKINSFLNTFLFQDENKNGFEFLRIAVILMKLVDKVLFFFCELRNAFVLSFFFGVICQPYFRQSQVIGGRKG